MERLEMENLLFSFLLHEHLLDFALLLLSDFHHDLLNPNIHLFLVLISANRLQVNPGMLHDVIERDTLVWIRVKHFLDEV